MHSRSASEGFDPSRRTTWQSAVTVNSMASTNSLNSSQSVPEFSAAYQNKPLPPTPPPYASRLDAPFSMLDEFDVVAMPKPLNIRKQRQHPHHHHHQQQQQQQKQQHQPLPLVSKSPSQPLSQQQSQPELKRSATTKPNIMPRAAAQKNMPQHETRSASPPRVPFTPPVVDTCPLQTYNTSPASTATVTRPRASRKVMQLMGHDIDVMDVPPVVPGPCLAERESQPLYQNEFQHQSPTQPRKSRVPDVYHTSYEYLMPLLEDDVADDDKSSKTSSWGPSSPTVGASAPHPTIVGEDFGDDMTTLYEAEEGEDGVDPTDPEFYDLAAEEYHKWSVQLASESRHKSEEDVYAPDVRKKKRASALLSFASGAQFTRRRKRPDSINPFAGFQLPMGDDSASEKTSTPATINTESTEEEAVPKSGWDSDSDDEEQVSRTLRWRRDRSHSRKGEERNGRESPSFQLLRETSRTWSISHDSMKDFISSAKGKAYRSERRKIEAIPEGVAA